MQIDNLIWFLKFQFFLDEEASTADLDNPEEKENEDPQAQMPSSKRKIIAPANEGQKIPKRDSAVDVLKREAEVTIDYLQERKRNEALKDQLTIASLKASIRHHESAVQANEAKSAWYRAKLERDGFIVPSSEPLSFESQLSYADWTDFTL